MRIVSLVPSASETLIAWGIEPVAVTRFCELGDRFATVGGTKDPDVEAIINLRPDLVVMCDQENRAPDATALETAGVKIHVVHILDVAQVGPEMVRLAEVVGIDPTLGEACAPPAQPTTSPAHQPTTSPGSNPGTIRTVFVPIWKRPWMSLNGSTYATTLLATMGLRSVCADSPDTYPTIDPEGLRADLVVAPSEPYPFAERHRAELEQFGPVTFVDGRDLFWWGARTPKAHQRLQAQLCQS